MDLALADKTVLITGASGGIGRALAQAFADEGARLALGAGSRGDELIAWLADQPFADRALALPFDITDAGAVDAAFARARERFGRLDACLANAGVWPPEDVPLARMSPERLRRTIDVDLLGAAYTARAFLACLERTGPRDDGHGASLVFTGSTAGRFGERMHSDYSLAKAGLSGLVQSLKHEIVDLDPYGRVNMVEPGWTVTHMARPTLDQPGVIGGVVRTMPLRQLARAKDIAATCVYLTSPTMARHVSGQQITVAGGMEGRVRWERDDVDEQAVRDRLKRD